MLWYGHPFLTEGAGRIKTDSLNEERIQKVLNRYQEWSKLKKNIPLQWIVTKEQVYLSSFVFPLTGLAMGLLASYTFVHPNSQYIGKCFTLLTTIIGWKVHKRYQNSYDCSRRFGNFALYPTEIQKMIDNNDARYAYKWLQDNYMQL